MTKAELVMLVAEKTGQTHKEAEKSISAFVEVVTETLSKRGEKVVVSGLGTFEVRDRAQRTGKNPRTGEELVIPAQRTPAFKAGKQLKDAVKS